MYFIITKYTSDLGIQRYEQITDTKIYVLDTSDWTIEQIHAHELIESGVVACNMRIVGSKFVITEEDFLLSMLDAHEIKCTDTDGVLTYKLNISGRQISIRVERYNSDDIYEECVIINGIKVLHSDCEICFNYAFIFKEYIVLRLSGYIGLGSDVEDWFSVAIDKDNNVHYWALNDCKDSVGTMIDMISEV